MSKMKIYLAAHHTLPDLDIFKKKRSLHFFVQLLLGESE